MDAKQLASLLLIVSFTAQAQLPQASTLIGDIKRDENGKLVLQSGPPAPQADQTPQPIKPDNLEPETFSGTKVRIGVPGQAKTAANHTTPPPSLSQIDNTPPRCSEGAITCVEVISNSAKTQISVPFTFGQPFKAGDLHKGSGLSASDAGGPLAIQMDELSSHPDGSIRFAVLSSQISNLKPGEKRVVNLLPAKTSAPPTTLQPPEPKSLDIKLTAKVYSPQITVVHFGNRNGYTSGISFETGEQITLQIGNEADELFTHTIGKADAGGHFSSLTKLAENFRDLINQRSKHYRAYKLGEGGGYEKLWITGKTPGEPKFRIQAIYAGNGKISQYDEQAYQSPKQFVARAKPALEHALGKNQVPRLNGMIVREYTLLAPFIDESSGKKHPQLTARLHVRFINGNNRIHTDFVLENNWTYEPEPGNLTYDLTITKDKKILHEQAPFTHYHHARWHKLLWVEGDPTAVRIRHHMPYFIDTKLVGNYDLTLRPALSSLEEEAARMRLASNTPMGSGFITHYFPTTGGRPEIGPLPRWAALYIVSQHPAAEEVMLSNASAAATIPIHYRDTKTDFPVSLEDHPGIALLFGRSSNKDAVPNMKNAATPWTPDDAHQGSFSYLPYLLTGDAFYQDETAFWANWNMAAIDPVYRQNSKGLITSAQTRGQAWALRSIGEASRVFPDRHPLSAYFSKKLNENINWYNIYYQNSGAGNLASPLGAAISPHNPGQAAPWQNDFLAIVLGQLALLGHPQAHEYFNRLTKFTVGRFQNEENGFCRYRATGYWIKIRENSQAINDWKTLAKANWPNDGACSSLKIMDGYPESASGYAAYARAMLAVASDLKIHGARESYDWLKKSTPKISSELNIDPTWAIVPR